MDSMPPRLGCRRREGKQGGMWAPCCLVFDAPGKSGSGAACGLHTASSSMPQEGVETRRRVDSTPPRLRSHGKEKRGGMWFSCRLVIDTTARRGNNEAACGFHATSLCSRLNSPVVPLLAFSNYWLLSWSVSWHHRIGR